MVGEEPLGRASSSMVRRVPVFKVEGDRVLILTIRHGAQQELTEDDLDDISK
jgi:plasmid stabilization system protein ParE